MVCFRYIIVNTLHESGKKDNNNNNTNNNNNNNILDLSSQKSYMIQLLTHTTTQSKSLSQY